VTAVDGGVVSVTAGGETVGTVVVSRGTANMTYKCISKTHSRHTHGIMLAVEIIRSTPFSFFELTVIYYQTFTHFQHLQTPSENSPFQIANQFLTMLPT